MNVQMEPSWKEALTEEFGKGYFKELTDFVREEYLSKNIFPTPQNIFSAFAETPFDEVRVVILGQDPYHGKGQAHGLSFSVAEGVRVPPSLQNIYKEIESDIGVPRQGLGTGQTGKSGDLTRWATQGALLLNSTLTVEEGKPGSHQGKGWEQFTDAVIEKLSTEKEHLVFILWGNYAKAKGVRIDRTKHLVIESPHPSPFSAHTGFFGSKPFSRTNEYLRGHNVVEIDWR
jgi:uracil-DNA glycosylase